MFGTRVACPTPDDIHRAVEAYNKARGCGDEDAKLWSETARARSLVLGSNDSPEAPTEIAEYAEAVRFWGSIQGVFRDDYSKVARALWFNPIRSAIWAMREGTILTTPLTGIIQLEEGLVREMLIGGVARKHYSWASKMLHFLLPATVPIYDSFVREYLMTTDGIEGFAEIVARARECVHELLLHEAYIVGNLEPKTLLRALDKFYWWERRRAATQDL